VRAWSQTPDGCDWLEKSFRAWPDLKQEMEAEAWLQGRRTLMPLKRAVPENEEDAPEVEIDLEEEGSVLASSPINEKREEQIADWMRTLQDKAIGELLMPYFRRGLFGRGPQSLPLLVRFHAGLLRQLNSVARVLAGPSDHHDGRGGGGSSYNTGNFSSFSNASGFSESDNNNAGSSNASGSSWSSDTADQDYYHDQTSWSAPYNQLGTPPSSGTAIDQVGGGETISLTNRGWWTSQVPASGGGAGFENGSSWSGSGASSTGYGQYVSYPGFYQGSVGTAGPIPTLDAEWRWGEGWAGAGRNGPLGPSVYSGLGYVFASGDPVTVAAIDDQSDAEGQAVSVQASASNWSASSVSIGGVSVSGIYTVDCAAEISSMAHWVFTESAVPYQLAMVCRWWTNCFNCSSSSFEGCASQRTPSPVPSS
jgi:hypothetical protein